MKRPTKIATPLTALGLILAMATMGLGGRTAIAPRKPDATEANITRLTTSLLEHSQFAHRPFDRELAQTFLDRYMDSLDGARTLFFRGDVDEFARYGATLAETTRDSGDARPAQAIFDRYLERLGQRTAYVAGALRTGTFDFTGHDAYSFDREHASRPRDLAAAQALWRQELRAEYLQAKLDDQPPEKIVSTLTHRYEEQLRTMKSLHSDDVLEIYLDALAHVYDPHSDYMGHEQMESFDIAMNLSLFGIGATLEEADGTCKVRDLVAGGPAARSGLLRPGDRIVAVAQAGQPPVDIVNMPLSRAVELIRGPKGTTVVLKIIPADAPDGSPTRTASFVRDEVKLEDQEAKASLVDLPTSQGKTVRLGVIDLPSFYSDMGEHKGAERRSATVDVARLIAKLKAESVQGIALDLRRNGGGSLDEAIRLTGLFIRKGPVVQTRDQAGNIDVGTDDDPAVAYDGPLVVLTSRFSASASEILAGALQDYGRALIVGDSSTFGKGTVQNIVPLGRIMDRMGLAHSYDPGAFKVTISKFYRPSGASTQLRGVASDIVLPSGSDFREVGESTLKDALPWDQVAPTQYPYLNRVRPYVDALRGSSAQRVAVDKDFTFEAAEIARLRDRLSKKSVSLNEADRRDELAQEKARREESRQRARAFQASRPVTYAITLENVDVPGLPAPLHPVPDGANASSVTGPSGTDDLIEPSMDRPAADDIVLNEGERILADYAGLLAGKNAKASLDSSVTTR